KGTIHLFDLATGKELLHLRAHENGVHNVAFGAESGSLVSMGYDTNRADEVCHWDAKTGAQLKVVAMPWKPFGRPTVRLAPDGQTVAVPLSGIVHLIDTTTGKDR